MGMIVPCCTRDSLFISVLYTDDDTGHCWSLLVDPAFWSHGEPDHPWREIPHAKAAPLIRGTVDGQSIQTLHPWVFWAALQKPPIFQCYDWCFPYLKVPDLRVWRIRPSTVCPTISPWYSHEIQLSHILLVKFSVKSLEGKMCRNAIISFPWKMLVCSKLSLTTIQ